MAVIDRLKEELAFQKQLFFASVGVILAVSGWLATNYVQIGLLILLLSAFVVLSSALFAYTRFELIYELLEDIENA